MEVDSAYRKSLDTVVDWILREVNTRTKQVFFRTYAPVHFRISRSMAKRKSNVEPSDTQHPPSYEEQQRNEKNKKRREAYARKKQNRDHQGAVEVGEITVSSFAHRGKRHTSRFSIYEIGSTSTSGVEVRSVNRTRMVRSVNALNTTNLVTPTCSSTLPPQQCCQYCQFTPLDLDMSTNFIPMSVFSESSQE